MSLVFEVCVDSVGGAVSAQRAGAQRVELCAALFSGGITPSLGLIAEAVSAVDIRVHVIVRPRGGDFIYDGYEARAMERDVAAVRDAGAHGVVIGALTPDGAVDSCLIRRLVWAAGDLSLTFHRAFDMTADPAAALEELIDLGVHRVLTSGQDVTAWEGAPLIAALVERAGDRIVVMPGGGVTARNIRRILDATGAREVHFGADEVRESPAVFRNPRPFMGGALRQPEYAHRVTSESTVREIIATVRD